MGKYLPCFYFLFDLDYMLTQYDNMLFSIAFDKP